MLTKVFIFLVCYSHCPNIICSCALELLIRKDFFFFLFHQINYVDDFQSDKPFKHFCNYNILVYPYSNNFLFHAYKFHIIYWISHYFLLVFFSSTCFFPLPPPLPNVSPSQDSKIFIDSYLRLCQGSIKTHFLLTFQLHTTICVCRIQVTISTLEQS